MSVTVTNCSIGICQTEIGITIAAAPDVTRAYTHEFTFDDCSLMYEIIIDLKDFFTVQLTRKNSLTYSLKAYAACPITC